MKPMVITHEGGLKFAADIRGHRLVVDQPVPAGGEDSAPMPLELLGASLGTCVALYVQQFCQARSLPYEGMRVEVEPHGAHGRIERFDVRVVLPHALPPRYSELLERVARSCPAHNTLVTGAEVDVQIEQSAHVS
jgi:uncharacterized OsmC-like protein